MTLDTIVFVYLNGMATHSRLLDGVGIFFASYAIYILALIPALPRKKQRIVQEAFSVALSLVSVNLIRFLWHRPRPFNVEHTNLLIAHLDSASFPSSHATISFALAQTIHSYDKKLGICAYIAAALISLARVFVGMHYPSDVLAGAVLGIAMSMSAKWILNRNLRTSLN